VPKSHGGLGADYATYALVSAELGRHCGSLMLPWTAELCMDRIGREALYEPGESDELTA
jgi:alkylation response protein AidB-like acyl-CoA dehydrogenase